MKVKICASGTMLVASESELEAYALQKWLEDNPIEGPVKMIVKTSFPIKVTPVHDVEKFYD